MSNELDVVRRVFRAVEERDLDGLLSCYRPEVRIVKAPALPYSGVYRGLDGARQHAAGFTKAWSRFQSANETPLEPRFVSDGSGTVTVLFRHRARDGDRVIDYPEVSTYEVVDGLITYFQMFHLAPTALTAFLDTAT